MSQKVKNLPAMQETWVWSLGGEDPLEKEMATHSSILAWRIPWTEVPSGLQSMGSLRVGQSWATNINERHLDCNQVLRQCCSNVCNVADRDQWPYVIIWGLKPSCFSLEWLDCSCKRFYQVRLSSAMTIPIFHIALPALDIIQLSTVYKFALPDISFWILGEIDLRILIILWVLRFIACCYQPFFLWISSFWQICKSSLLLLNVTFLLTLEQV